MDADAWGICPACDKDFFVPLVIREDRLLDVDSTRARRGFGPDSPGGEDA